VGGDDDLEVHSGGVGWGREQKVAA
jgi:hypothetical protein